VIMDMRLFTGFLLTI